jgi:hypothetical protein
MYQKTNGFWDDGWLSKILSKLPKKRTKNPSFFSQRLHILGKGSFAKDRIKTKSTKTCSNPNFI